MEKFKNTNYFHHDGELFNKNRKRLLKDKNRYRITNNGKKISVLSSDIQQIISLNHLYIMLKKSHQVIELLSVISLAQN